MTQSCPTVPYFNSGRHTETLTAISLVYIYYSSSRQRMPTYSTLYRASVTETRIKLIISMGPYGDDAWRPPLGNTRPAVLDTSARLRKNKKAALYTLAKIE